MVLVAPVTSAELHFPAVRSPIEVIGAFTPSDPVTEGRIARLEKLEATFKTRNISVRYTKHALLQPPTGRVAAHLRAFDFRELIERPDVDVAISVCGGKTCQELLPFIDFRAIRESAKPLFGFSNACILLNAVSSLSEIVTFYGPESLNRLALSSRFVDQLLDVSEWTAPVQGSRYTTISPGMAEGRLFGGNLSSFMDGIFETNYEPRWERRLFFWEAGSGDAWQIAVMLETLLNAGFERTISGMLVGVIGDDPQAEAVSRLAPVLRRFNVPVLYLPVFGHFRDANPIIPIGAKGVLDADAGRLMIVR